MDLHSEQIIAISGFVQLLVVGFDFFYAELRFPVILLFSIFHFLLYIFLPCYHDTHIYFSITVKAKYF